jgi:hypothetical protein
VPPTAKHYSKAGLPWFGHYSDAPGVSATPLLERLKSVITVAKEKGDVLLPENERAHPKSVVALRSGLQPGQIREGGF